MEVAATKNRRITTRLDIRLILGACFAPRGAFCVPLGAQNKLKSDKNQAYNKPGCYTRDFCRFFAYFNHPGEQKRHPGRHIKAPEMRRITNLLVIRLIFVAFKSILTSFRILFVHINKQYNK